VEFASPTPRDQHATRQTVSFLFPHLPRYAVVSSPIPRRLGTKRDEGRKTNNCRPFPSPERCIDVSDCCAGNNACSPSSSGGQNVCQQVVEDPCDVTYTASGNGVGNGVIPAPEPANGRDCCLLCRDTPNCVASAFPSGCQLLVKLEPLDGAPTSLMCPLGKENYDFLPGPGSVYRGPCSLP